MFVPSPARDLDPSHSLRTCFEHLELNLTLDLKRAGLIRRFSSPAYLLPHGFDESYNRVTFSRASTHRRLAAR